MKELIVVAGPNGAGKSTFVASFLSEKAWPYLCADAIATEFPHLDSMSQQIAAGREFLLRLEQQLSSDQSFIIARRCPGEHCVVIFVVPKLPISATGFEVRPYAMIVTYCYAVRDRSLKLISENVEVE